MNCRLQDEVQSMCEGAEAWCAGNRKFWAAAVGHKQSLAMDLFRANHVVFETSLIALFCYTPPSMARVPPFYLPLSSRMNPNALKLERN